MSEILHQKTRTFYVGIGIDNYHFFPRLGNAERDVRSLENLLKQRFGIDKSYILGSKNATKAEILDLLTLLIEEITEVDSLIMYYAGHGTISTKKKGFWIPVDASPKQEVGWLRNSTIIDKLDDLSMRHLVLFCDSCFSGSLVESGLYRSTTENHDDILNTIDSRWVICSGGSDQVVQDGEHGGNSPFASSLLKILSDPLLRQIRIGSLVEELRKLTSDHYKQVLRAGQLNEIGHKGGQYVFYASSREEEFWKTCMAKNTPDAFQKYIGDYPDGLHIDIARKLLRGIYTKRKKEVLEKTSNQTTELTTLEHLGRQWLSDIEPSVGYTWTEANNNAIESFSSPSMSEFKEMYKSSSYQKVESIFSFKYPGYIDESGQTRGKGQLQCFWTRTEGKFNHAFAFVFNKDFTRAYKKELDKNSRLPLLLLKQ